MTTPGCNCNEGFFNAGEIDCTPCAARCKSCMDYATSCTDCSDNTTRDYSDNCNCRPTYFEDGSSVCPSCIHPCITCIGSNLNCLSCVAGSNRGPWPYCACDDGYYDNTATCELCDNTVCGTCVTDAITCVIPCNNDCKTCDITGICISCDDGKYLSNGECLDCSHPCTKCITTDLTCTECVAGTNRGTFPNCHCDDGYYDNVLTLLCKKCDETICGTCH
jgi:proprotein convertase subtilisin/kexin type 5